MSDVVWHDLECGQYREDLPLWHELAGQYLPQGQALLDVGAGTGRVTLALARAGHHVVALDSDPALLSELRSRAAGLSVETVCADARAFDLSGRLFSLIIVPMQTLQLLGGRGGHETFLARARAHLVPAGIVAVAIADSDDFEEFEWDDGAERAPLPDITEIAGRVYFSQPTAVRRVGHTFVLQRRRDIVEPDGERTSTENTIALDLVTAEAVALAGRAAGLRLHGTRRVDPTDEHIGSEVVLLSA